MRTHEAVRITGSGFRSLMTPQIIQQALGLVDGERAANHLFWNQVRRLAVELVPFGDAVEAGKGSSHEASTSEYTDWIKTVTPPGVLFASQK